MKDTRAASAIALAAALAAWAVPAGAQALSPFLPSAQRSRAAGLLDAVEAASKGIEKRREAAFAALAEAEAEAIPAYAAASASDGESRWAGPGGIPAAGKARESFEAARSRALAAARSLAFDGMSAEGKTAAELSAEREASADRLSSLIAASVPGSSARSGVAKALLSRSKGLGSLFPEAIEAGGALGGGAAGLGLWIDALARRGPEAVAARLCSRSEEAVKAAPGAGKAMAGLKAAYEAFAALEAGLSDTLHPSLLHDAPLDDAAAARRAIESLNALADERAASLLSAMERGDGRSRAAALGARRLAAAYQGLPKARAGLLGKLLGLDASALERFARLAGSARKAPAGSVAAADEADEAAALKRRAATLDRARAALAQREAAEAAAGAKGGSPIPRQGLPDPLLPLLGDPGLLRLAGEEPRYARFYGQAGARLGALYEIADAAACAELEKQASVSAALAKALGGRPSSYKVVAETLADAGGAEARVLCFEAVSEGEGGGKALLPIGSALASAAYAKAFAAAFGLGAAGSKGAKVEAGAVLTAYGQRVVTAPVAKDGSGFVLESFPRAETVDGTELEVLLFSGDEP